MHLEFLVEEQSMEVFLQGILPRLLPNPHTFKIHVFQGKSDLMKRLSERLRGYYRWLPCNYRIVVMVDRDDDDCRALKMRLNAAVEASHLRPRSRAGHGSWQVVNCIVIEELEAWYFGDWEAVRRAYPKVSENTTRKVRYRNPDAISGGTCQAFERILKRHGYFKTGLRKIEAAQAIAAYVEPERNRSHSFAVFRKALAAVTA